MKNLFSIYGNYKLMYNQQFYLNLYHYCCIQNWILDFVGLFEKKKMYTCYICIVGKKIWLWHLKSRSSPSNGMPCIALSNALPGISMRIQRFSLPLARCIRLYGIYIYIYVYAIFFPVASGSIYPYGAQRVQNYVNYREGLSVIGNRAKLPAIGRSRWACLLLIDKSIAYGSSALTRVNSQLPYDWIRAT